MQDMIGAFPRTAALDCHEIRDILDNANGLMVAPGVCADVT